MPARLYWQHWFRYWKVTEEPSEVNVVLGIVGFTLYIANVCDTCKHLLELKGYRIHPAFGVQHRRIQDGVPQWVPDPHLFARRFQQALAVVSSASSQG